MSEAQPVLTDPQPRPRRSLVPHARALGVALAAGCGALGLYQVQVTGEGLGRWMFPIAMAIAAVAQFGLRYPAPPPLPPRAPASRWRRVVGVILAIGGAVIWTVATRRIYLHWVA